MQIDTTIRDRVLEGKNTQEQLELKAHWALCDLSELFRRRSDKRYYEVNKLIHLLMDLRQT